MGLINLTVKTAAITSAIAAAIFVAAIAYGLHVWIVGDMTRDHKKALTAQKTALVADCNSDKSITKDTDDAIYNNHNDIDAILANRLRDNTAPKCVSVTSETGGATTPASQGKLHGSPRSDVSVSRAELYRLAADADKIKADLIECRTFIDRTWAAKGHYNN